MFYLIKLSWYGLTVFDEMPQWSIVLQVLNQFLMLAVVNGEVTAPLFYSKRKWTKLLVCLFVYIVKRKSRIINLDAWTCYNLIKVSF